MFAFRWDGVDLLGMAKKLLCFVQEYRNEWDYIAWNQIAKRGGQAIDSKHCKVLSYGISLFKMSEFNAENYLI